MNSGSILLLLTIVFGSVAAFAGPQQRDGNQARVTIYVLGPVSYPGKQSVKPDSSVNEVIEAAGGADDDIHFGKCRIIRGKNEIQIKRDDFDKSRSGRWRMFQANDVIMLSFWRFSME